MHTQHIDIGTNRRMAVTYGAAPPGFEQAVKQHSLSLAEKHTIYRHDLCDENFSLLVNNEV